MIITNSNNSSNYCELSEKLLNISTSKIFSPDLFVWLWSIRKASSYTFCKQTVHQYWDSSTVKGPELWLCLHVWEYCQSDLCANSFCNTETVVWRRCRLCEPGDYRTADPLNAAKGSDSSSGGGVIIFHPTQVHVFEDKTKCFKHILQPWRVHHTVCGVDKSTFHIRVKRCIQGPKLLHQLSWQQASPKVHSGQAGPNWGAWGQNNLSSHSQWRTKYIYSSTKLDLICVPLSAARRPREKLWTPPSEPS